MKLKMLMSEASEHPKRVMLLLETEEGELMEVAELHPKQAEALMRIYGRAPERYDALY